jgi:hypothetical protein
LQTPDSRGVHIVGPRYIRLCFASSKPGNRFLPLMARQLSGPAEFDAALLRTLAPFASAGTDQLPLELGETA